MILVLHLSVPGADEDLDAPTVAREFAHMINEERGRNGGASGPVTVTHAAWAVAS